MVDWTLGSNFHLHGENLIQSYWDEPTKIEGDPELGSPILMPLHIFICYQSPSQEEQEVETDWGLLKGYTYTMTDIRKLRLGERLVEVFSTEKLYMVRLRNPLGRQEWSGPWSEM